MTSPEAKRKKVFTKNEVVEKLLDNENDVAKVVEQIVKEMCPFDLTDDTVMQKEERVERLDRVCKCLSAKVYKLKNDLKNKKFKHKPELLEEKSISSSQYSVLQDPDSQELCDSLSLSQISDKDYEEIESEPELPKGRPNTYKKKPLNHNMTQFSRRRRVAEKRQMFAAWAEEEGVTVTELLGYLLHLDNWNEGDRVTASAGWRLFTGEKLLPTKPTVSLEEATWIIERSGMSQVVWQDVRLKVLDRIWLPPVMKVRTENKLHRPALSQYRHGVKAPLQQCLKLTLDERLQLLDLSELDVENMQVFFEFTWGLDGSGDHQDYHQLTKTPYSTKQIKEVLAASFVFARPRFNAKILPNPTFKLDIVLLFLT